MSMIVKGLRSVLVFGPASGWHYRRARIMKGTSADGDGLASHFEGAVRV